MAGSVCSICLPIIVVAVVLPLVAWTALPVGALDRCKEMQPVATRCGGSEPPLVADQTVYQTPSSPSRHPGSPTAIPSSSGASPVSRSWGTHSRMASKCSSGRISSPGPTPPARGGDPHPQARGGPQGQVPHRCGREPSRGQPQRPMGHFDLLHALIGTASPGGGSAASTSSYFSDKPFRRVFGERGV